MGILDRNYTHDIYKDASSRLKDAENRLNNSETFIDKKGNLVLVNKFNESKESNSVFSFDKQKEFRDKNKIQSFPISSSDSLLEVFLNQRISFFSVVFMISFIFFFFSFLRFIK